MKPENQDGMPPGSAILMSLKSASLFWVVENTVCSSKSAREGVFNIRWTCFTLFIGWNAGVRGGTEHCYCAFQAKAHTFFSHLEFFNPLKAIITMPVIILLKWTRTENRTASSLANCLQRPGPRNALLDLIQLESCLWPGHNSIHYFFKSESSHVEIQPKDTTPPGQRSTTTTEQNLTPGPSATTHLYCQPGPSTRNNLEATNNMALIISSAEDETTIPPWKILDEISPIPAIGSVHVD